MNYNQTSDNYPQNNDNSSPEVALSIKVLFGSLTAQMSWFLVGIGMVFVFIFVRDVDLSNYYLGADSPKAIGKVIQIEDTGYWHNKKPIYAIIYQFNDSQGYIQTNTSYAIGNSLNIGDQVNIQYLANKPTYSRIEGLLKSTTQPFGLTVVIFPLVGIILVIRNLFLGFKTLKLLKNRQPNAIEENSLSTYLPTSITGTFAPASISLVSVLPYLIIPGLTILAIIGYIYIIL